MRKNLSLTSLDPTEERSEQKVKKTILVLSIEVSGMNRFLLSFLKNKYNLIIYNVKLPMPSKIYNGITSLSLNRDKFWESYLTTNYQKRIRSPYTFWMRTRYCEKEIGRLNGKFDIILQIGGMFAPSFNSISRPYTIFTSNTTKLTAKYWPDWTPFNRKQKAFKFFQYEEKLYKNAGRIFTTNNYARDSIIADYGIQEKNIITVGYGVNFEQLPCIKKRYDTKTILFIGKEFKRKGGFVLLKAFEKVKKEIKDAKLIIVGPVSIKSDRPDVQVKGLINDREEIRKLYENASIFVMPSLFEPFGLVFLEAMSYRLACIGTTNNAMPEIIKNGETGYLIEPNNSNELADKIIDLLKEERLLHTMGEKAFERVSKNFNWDKVANRIGKEFDKILDF